MPVTDAPRAPPEAYMTRFVSAALVTAALVISAVPARAQDQGFSVNLGAFFPKGEDNRATGDVLNANRCLDVSFACEPLLFEIEDFRGFTFSGEYVVGIGRFFEATAGVGFYQRTAPSIYEFVVNPDQSEIEQDLKLRIVPITGTVRFVPTGRDAAFQPYIGVGVAALTWRYSESGSFVDPIDSTIFRAQYKADGTEVAPIFLGGVRFPVATDKFLLGGEVRFQKAEADLPTEDFLGDKIDLGGTTFQATLTWKF
jgi:hypothetical protein